MEGHTRIALRAADGSVRAWTLIDESDAAIVTRWRWSLKTDGYAQRVTRINGKQASLRLHRVLLGLEIGDPRQVDHVNGDRLDNRRENLRIVTLAENRQNLSVHGGTSHHRGVYWIKKRQRWGARASVNSKPVWIGSFATELEAAQAASRFRADHMPFSRERDAG